MSLAEKLKEEGLAGPTSTVEPVKAPQQLIDEEERRWYQWFSKYDTPAERRLIVKLDLLIVLFSVAVYWCKYLDQSNISNAYVSGMSDELGFHGNELVQFQTVYIVGAAVMQLPFIWIFVKVPMNIVVPTLDIGWGIMTLLQYRTQSYGEMIAYRFLVGCFEAAFFPAVHWVLGSWYRKDEIARRGGIFYLGLYLGTLTSGLLQSATLRGLDGHLGLAAWRWMFIINAIISIPLGLMGYLLWPGTPDKCHSFFISKEEIQLAKDRLARVGHTSEVLAFTLQDFKDVLKGWKIYVLTFWDILFWNCGPNSSSYLLWLKHTYPTNLPKVNDLSVTASALGIPFTIITNFSADLLRSPRLAITGCNTFLLIGILILASGTGNIAALFVGYNLLAWTNAQSSSLYGWSNAILRRNPKERVIILIVMNTVAQASTAFIGLLTYPTVEAPRFKKGFIFSAVITLSQIVFTQVVAWFANRDDARYALADRELAASVDAATPAESSASSFKERMEAEEQGRRTAVSELRG